MLELIGASVLTVALSLAVGAVIGGPWQVVTGWGGELCYTRWGGILPPLMAVVVAGCGGEGCHPSPKVIHCCAVCIDG